MGDGSPKRVDEALATWRQAERTLDAAVKEREAVEAKAEAVEKAEATVTQTAADAEATVEAARQAERSAEEAAAAVAQIAEATQEDLAKTREAEEAAAAAREAAQAAHRPRTTLWSVTVEGQPRADPPNLARSSTSARFGIHDPTERGSPAGPVEQGRLGDPAEGGS